MIDTSLLTYPRAVWVFAFLLVLHGCWGDESKPKLTRQQGKRWSRLDDIARAEIKSATQRFLNERNHALHMPVEVDVLLVGFDGDGGYGYTINKPALEELLGSTTAGGLCPMAWDTGEASAVCYNLNYIMLDTSYTPKAIEGIEHALQQSMQHLGDRSHDWADGSKNVQVYEVEASEHMEAAIWEVLEKSYGPEPPTYGALTSHSAIVVINPSKVRMSPLHSPAEAHAADRLLPTQHHDLIAQWRSGAVNTSQLVEQEAGYVYRYKYQGVGAGAAWLSQYNFLVIDVSAGPVSFGPLASPSGAVTPTGMPRLLPVLLRMAREIATAPGIGTLREHLINQAEKGQTSVFLGQLAQTMASAVQYVFTPDIVTDRIDTAFKRLLVPVMVLQDHGVQLAVHPGLDVDADSIQLALDEVLPSYQTASVTVARASLRNHPRLLAAITKARIVRSEPALAEPPDQGMHMHDRVVLSAADIVQELLMAQDSLVQSLGIEQEPYDDDSVHAPEDPYAEEHSHKELAESDVLDLTLEQIPQLPPPKKQGTSVLPVFVLSLQRAPDGLTFDNGHQVVATKHMVVVIQLVGKGPEPEDLEAQLYMGHTQEGNHVTVSATRQPARHVIAGLMTALAGVVPPYQRWDADEGAVVEDWRWSVGALPWGPYSRFEGVSTIIVAAAKRNLVVSHVEGTLRRLQERLDTMDTFIVQHLQSPFAYLSAPHAAVDSPHVAFAPGHHLLDDLAGHSVAYAPNATLTSARKFLESLSPEDRAILDGGVQSIERMWHQGAKDIPHGDTETEAQLTERVHKQYAKLEELTARLHRIYTPLPGDTPQLTPQVAQRLTTKLVAIAHAIEQLAYVLYAKSWEQSDKVSESLRALVADFVQESSKDLTHGIEVAACCTLVHQQHQWSSAWFAVSVVLFTLVVFAIAAFVAYRQMVVGVRPRRRSTPKAAVTSLFSGASKWLPPTAATSPRPTTLPRYNV